MTERPYVTPKIDGTVLPLAVRIVRWGTARRYAGSRRVFVVRVHIGNANQDGVARYLCGGVRAPTRSTTIAPPSNSSCAR